MCFLSLEYATDVTYGSNMAVTVKLDNVVMFSANHNGSVTPFTPVPFSVPCGQRLEQPQGDLSVAPDGCPQRSFTTFIARAPVAGPEPPPAMTMR